MSDTTIPRYLSSEWTTRYAQELSKQIKRGREYRIQQGRWPGVAPLGYCNERRKGKASIGVDAVIAPLVQQSFSLAAEGNHSLKTELEIMTERGLRSKNGKPLSKAAFLRLLTNPFYTGKIPFEGKLVPGVHEPLIDQETFERVQERLTKRQQR